jgi:hypothetical protein
MFSYAEALICGYKADLGREHTTILALYIIAISGMHLGITSDAYNSFSTWFHSLKNGKGQTIIFYYYGMALTGGFHTCVRSAIKSIPYHYWRIILKPCFL